MRAVVWNRDYEEDYDDLSSMAPSARHPREPLPEPPLPESSKWRHAARPSSKTKKVLTAELCIAAGFVSLLLLAILAANNPTPYRIDYAIACLLLATMTLALGYWGVRLWSEGTVASQEVRWLALDVGVENSYPVRVCIFQDRVLTGVDEGIVYFRKDALHFHGLRCDFVIGAQNLRFDPHMMHTPHGYEECGYIRSVLSLRHPTKNIEVAFDPYSKLSKYDHRDCIYRFRKELRLFLHNWRVSHEKSVYPPLETVSEAAAESPSKAVTSR